MLGCYGDSSDFPGCSGERRQGIRSKDIPLRTNVRQSETPLETLGLAPQGQGSRSPHPWVEAGPLAAPPLPTPCLPGFLGSGEGPEGTQGPLHSGVVTAGHTPVTGDL